MSESDEKDPFKGLILGGELSEHEDRRDRFGRDSEEAEGDVGEERRERQRARLEEYRRDRGPDGG